MPKQASGTWKRLRRSLATHPERLTGGPERDRGGQGQPAPRTRATGISVIQAEELPSWT